jgi:hypothetical protein
MSPEIRPPSTEAEPREEFVPRRGPFARKFLIFAAALFVTVVPVACSNAYADQTAEQVDHSGHNGPQKLFPVGGKADAGGDAKSGSGDTPADDNGGGKDSKSGDNNSNNNDNKSGNNNNSGNNKNNDNKNNNNNNNSDNKSNDNGSGAQKNNGLDVLGRDCSNSDLPPHNGFQEAPRCVETSFGEVASEDKSPSLLITQSPDVVKAGENFTLAVSTRNLVRDRFLGAAAGGYYLESSFLDKNGIQRGHFHTACRMLDDLRTAPDAAPDPAFFLATQDNGGGGAPDTVTVTVTGMPRAGTAQCAVWAGDGSHRVPMMQRANQTPAFDVVRITVK